MSDIVIDFEDGFKKIEAKTEKGLAYLKSHWKKRKLLFNFKFVKRWKIALFDKYNISWSILSNCTAIRNKQLERET